MLTPVQLKQAAAKAALDYVLPQLSSDSIIGIGTGSTSNCFISLLGQYQDRFAGTVASSEASAALLRDEGIPVFDLATLAHGAIDIYVDGADESNAKLQLIKGGGGAHLQEKIVATASDQMIVITDASKRVETLGAFPLPVEVIPFGIKATKSLVEETLDSMDVLGREVTVRMKGDAPFVTDEGNHILDLHLKRIGNPRQLSLVLNQIPGVVENGLFIDICDAVVVGYGDGRVEIQDIDNGIQDEGVVDLNKAVNLFRETAG